MRSEYSAATADGEASPSTNRRAAAPIDEVSRTLSASDRIAVFLGSERDGLTDSAMRSVRHRVRIPMADPVDSLNVAAAAAVACYALFRPTS